MRLASGTPLLYLEKGAVIADASPGLSGAVPENEGDAIKIHVDQMKQSRRRSPRKTVTTTPITTTTTTK